MESAQETAGPLKLSKLLKGRFSTTKEAKDTLNDLGMLTIGYFCTILEDIGRTRAVTAEDVERVFESLRAPMRQSK